MSGGLASWSAALAIGLFFDRFVPTPTPVTNVLPAACSCLCDCEGAGRAGLLFYVFSGAFLALAVERALPVAARRGLRLLGLQPVGYGAVDVVRSLRGAQECRVASP